MADGTLESYVEECNPIIDQTGEDAMHFVTEFELVDAVSLVLLSESIPIPPLIKCIAQYAIPFVGTFDISGVSALVFIPSHLPSPRIVCI